MKKRTLLLSALAAAVFATSAGALVACGDGVDLPEGGKKPPADTSHTVTFVAGADAKLTKITGNTLKTDKDGHLTATTMPEAEKNQNKENYTFLGWGLKAGATAPTITTTNFKTYVFDGDTPVYAVFKEKDTPVVEYDITFANGDHGTVSKTTVKTTNGGYITVAMLPTVTADAGWRHTGWTMDGAAVTFPKTFTSAKTITAVYEEVGNVDEQEYDITFANGDHGTVSATKVTTVDGVITEAMLPTVTAEDGWKHTGWEIDGVAATFPKTFTATATVTAVYEEIGEPDPDAPVVSVKKGETEIELKDNSASSLSTYEYMLAGEETTIHLEAGDVLTILIDGESPMPNFNLYNSHGATQNGNKVTINATGDFTFYLRYHEDGKWWNLEINDGKTDDLHVGHYYLVGAGFGWTCTAGGYMGETAGEKELTVEEGAPVSFKVVKCEDESGEIAWDENTVVLGQSDITVGKAYTTVDTMGNIVLSTAGTYTVKLVGGKLEITSDVELPDDPDVKADGLYVGGELVGALSLNTGNTADCTQYWFGSGVKVTLNKGDVVEFYINNQKLSAYIFAGSQGVEKPSTDVQYESFKITRTGEFEVYANKWNDTGNWQIEFSTKIPAGEYNGEIPADAVKVTVTFGSGATAKTVYLYIKEGNNFATATTIGNYYLYMWDGGTNHFGGWPGTKLQANMSTTMAYSSNISFIINKGSGKPQTGNLSGLSDGETYVVTFVSGGGTVDRVPD